MTTTTHPHMLFRRTTSPDDSQPMGGVTMPAEFIHDLTSASSAREVLDVSAVWTVRLSQADRSSMALVLPDGSALTLRAHSEDRHAIDQGVPIPLEGSLIGHCHTTSEPLRVDDLEHVDAFERAPLLADGMRAVLICPLLCQGERLGTINLGSTRPAAFTRHHETMLSTIASLVASFLRIHLEAERASEHALTDELTGHLNRRAILGELQRQMKRERKPSLLYADVDKFKAINDAYGHAQGDEVLKELMRRMANVLGDDDMLGRLGGDECLIVISDDPLGARAERLATTLRTACAEPFKIGQIEINPSVSIGVATGSSAMQDSTRMVAEADMAMYAAKKSQRGVAIADKAMHQRAQLEATIDRDLDEAFASGELTLFYQPVRSLQDGRILGAEALLRWNHQRFGWIPTPLLLERIEATGRTRSLTTWTLDTVAADWVRVRQAVPVLSQQSVALNLSPRQLAWGDYADAHAGTLQRHGLEVGDIMIEVVESTEIQPGDMAEQTLRRIGDAHVGIALDDFGTGHNALGYFTRFPIHMIKFDRSLVSSAVENDQARIIIGGLTRMAQDLGVIALAEGIETVTEADICADLDIEHGQGWHLGRPMTLDRFIEVAAEESDHDGRTVHDDLLLP